MLWKVPITIATAQNKQALTVLLDTVSTTVTMDIEDGDWIKVPSHGCYFMAASCYHLHSSILIK